MTMQSSDPGRSGVKSVLVLLCYPTFCRQWQEFFVFTQHGGLVSPSELASGMGAYPRWHRDAFSGDLVVLQGGSEPRTGYRIPEN